MLSDDDYWLNCSIHFLREIGISVQHAALGESEFLPGVRIQGQALLIEPARMLAASDVLHEAGHIAVTPPSQRALLIGALGPEVHFEWGGEVEAIAWSFAAAVHIGMPMEVLFHPLGYRGLAPNLALSYSLGVYPGAHGLNQAGMSLTPQQAAAQGAHPYPALLHWLRP